MLLASRTRYGLAAWCVLAAMCGAGCDAAHANDTAPAAPGTVDEAAASPRALTKPHGGAPAAQAATPAAPAAPATEPAATPSTASAASDDACNAVRARLATEVAKADAALTRALELNTEQARCVAQAIPGLTGTATFAAFDAGAIDQALKRGKRSRAQIHVWKIEPAVLAWSPLPEQRLIVISGQAADSGVVGVLRAHADGRLEHLASTLIREEASSIALGSSEQYPRNLLWTTCYECPGAGGNIRFEDDASVSFTYR